MSQSNDYEKLRAELLEAEIALRDQRERVAELRRRLPLDQAPATDYVFHEGPEALGAGDAPIREVRLSELCPADRPLVLVHFMFGKQQQEPCPMCTMWADGYNGVVHHLEQQIEFAVVVAGDVAAFRGYARTRGWDQIRILSSGASTFKRDCGMESEEGAQSPGVSVFARNDDGEIRHFYTGGAMLRDGEFRGMDLLSPVWNFFDLTPEGRGDFMPRKNYDV